MSSKYLLYVFVLLSLILLLSIVHDFIRTIHGKPEYSKPNIIGYIHVCQKGGWKKSFRLLMKYLKQYGLYDNVKEIRIGVINDTGILIQDEILNDEKIRIVYVGKSEEYERPTLLHMKQSSYTDDSNTLYFYLHTKGIKHFDTKFENVVVNWIEDMLYWNIQLWENAIETLRNYETYGCNYNGYHYAGNFWWANVQHLQKLPQTIPDGYTAPEDWILTNKDNLYCVHNCGDNFVDPYPQELYS